MTIKRQPSGGRYALVIGRGQAWVESFNRIEQTARVRFGRGFGSKLETVDLGQIDFGTVEI